MFLGADLLALGRRAAAEPLMRGGYKMMAATFPPQDP